MNGYLAMHDMIDLPDSVLDLPTFYLARRQRLEARLRDLLHVQGPTAGVPEA
jgi:hypothetical protein